MRHDGDQVAFFAQQAPDPLPNLQSPVFGIVQKVFLEKASAIARMRQKCVKNASKWVLFYWEKRNVPKCVRNASKLRQNAAKMRGTPLGENTFWTIPTLSRSHSSHPTARERTKFVCLFLYGWSYPGVRLLGP